jgi:uncharacterized protein involved in exopolysaccharide biosynthesis
MVADSDLPVRPKKVLMGAAGAVFGAIVGIAISLLLYRRELARRGRI